MRAPAIIVGSNSILPKRRRRAAIVTGEGAAESGSISIADSRGNVLHRHGAFCQQPHRCGQSNVCQILDWRLSRMGFENPDQMKSRKTRSAGNIGNGERGIMVTFEDELSADIYSPRQLGSCRAFGGGNIVSAPVMLAIDEILIKQR